MYNIKELLGYSVMIRILFLLLITHTLSLQLSIAQVDYQDQIQPIFNDNCTSCHGGQSGVILTSYDETMNSVGVQYGTNIVIPGEPDQSPLVDKIEPNPQYGSRMPTGGTFLEEEEINLIRQWIAEGALESVETSREIVLSNPDRFELLGNYPNPFNPTTRIRFTIPQSSEYLVRIIDLNGRMIREITGRHTRGIVSLPVRMDKQASGVYLYEIELRSGSKVEGKLSGKMTLIK